MTDEKDIAQLEAEIIRLRKLVYYDELTGLLNRLGFIEGTDNVFRAVPLRPRGAERRGLHVPFSVIFLDIDDFKKVNDEYGHNVGDIVLKAVAEAIKVRLRTSDVYARWGGEEFVVLLPSADRDAGQRVAEDLRKYIEDLVISVPGQSIHVTISLGIMEHSNEETLAEMLDKADKAMYQAKKNGKNRVELFIKE